MWQWWFACPSLDYLCIIGHPGVLSTIGGHFDELAHSEVQITFNGVIDRF
tara:strand:+ start:390 stop:539 length:150 start_codon:yes stop_codon:yes gene_type:complete